MRLLWFYTFALVLIFAFAFQHVHGNEHKKHGAGAKGISPQSGNQANRLPQNPPGGGHASGSHGKDQSLSPNRGSSRGSSSSSGHHSDKSGHKKKKHQGKGGKHHGKGGKQHKQKHGDGKHKKHSSG
ncbi:unnamed protein product [Rotaria sp. Silwood1]|nr:unnamed protein product [Rotaria sp. Silwood1]CAF3340877.1 unnamed protein product [Rotaria sp. Silwood1]CAF4647275.1 unnamed protein product [Rotaria sp. Silwood1]